MTASLPGGALTQTAQAVAKRKVSAESCVVEALSRIQRRDGDLGGSGRAMFGGSVVRGTRP